MRAKVISVALVLCVLFLLMFNLDLQSPRAPLFWLFGGAFPQQASVNALAGIDQRFRDTAAGGSLLLHLPGYDLNDPSQAMRAGAIYFRANYVLFPRRAFVGDRVRVINMATQLIPGDDTPPPPWMASHDVRGICVFPGPAAHP